jgi:prepilin-type processing-associated H-X9-DG protein/prepilin-type N-terminal cleavage/methylation domain-containing protein
MKLQRPPRTKSALTLTELLVVIAIIGILAALLLTAVWQAKGKAHQIQCVSNVRQLGLALKSFNTDYSVYPLFLNYDYRRGSYTDHFASWYAALSNELKNTNVWHCPSAFRPQSFPPNKGYDDYGYNSYGMSAISDTNMFGLGEHGGHRIKGTFAPPITESEIISPSEMMAIGDGFKGGDQVIDDGVFVLWRTTGLQDDLGSTKRSFARHQGRANVVFCDGHVESPTLQYLFEDTSDAALSRWNRDHLPHREKL